MISNNMRQRLTARSTPQGFLTLEIRKLRLAAKLAHNGSFQGTAKLRRRGTETGD